MGDLLLKQKPRPNPQWQQIEYRRPWPPMYRAPFQKHQFNFHPAEPKNYRDHTFNFAPNPNNIYQTNKSRDYYFLAPLYRNAMPPPPKPQSNRLIMMGNNNNKKRTKRITEEVCHCRSRSMDDVRFDVVELSPDENGNHVEMRNEKNVKPKGFKSVFGQHSMEDLLADTMYTAGPKRIGSCQVVLYFILSFQVYFKFCHIRNNLK